MIALDLMSRMIQYEPEKRISAAEALDHPWLAAFYDPEEDELLPQPQEFTRWQDIEELETVDEFREAIWEEIQVYWDTFKLLWTHNSLYRISGLKHDQ